MAKPTLEDIFGKPSPSGRPSLDSIFGEATEPEPKAISAFGGAMESRIEEARAAAPAARPVNDEAVAAGREFRAARTAKPIGAGSRLTTGEFAEQRTGISREEPIEPAATPTPTSTTRYDIPAARSGPGVAGKVLTNIGQGLDEIIESTTSPLRALLEGKSYDERLGERVLETTESLKGKASIRDAKKRAGDGTATDDDRRVLDADKTLNKVHAAWTAVKENPSDAAKELFFGLIEDLPAYIITAPIGGEMVKLGQGLAKTAKQSARMAKIAERLGEGTPAAARAIRAGETAEKVAATSGALVREAPTLRSVATEAVKDIPGDIAAGAALSQARGQDYDASQLAQDLVASAALAPAGALFSKLTDARPLSADEFAELQKAVQVAGIEKHPNIVKLLPGLQEAARNEKFTARNEKIRLDPAEASITGPEAQAAYGKPAAAALGLEDGADIKGVTEGKKITLQGGADAGTVDEELANFWVNTLKEDAAKAPDSPEGRLLADIEDHVEAIRRENATLPARQQIPLPQDLEKAFVQMYLANTGAVDVIPGMDLVELPKDLADRFTEFGGTAREVAPAAPRKLTGKGFTRADRAAADIEAERLRGQQRDQAAREGQQRILAEAKAAEDARAAEAADASREGQIKMMGEQYTARAGLLPPAQKPVTPLSEFLPEGRAVDEGRAARPALPIEESAAATPASGGMEVTPQAARAKMLRRPLEEAPTPDRFELPSVAAEDASGLRRPLESDAAPAKGAALREFLPDDVRVEGARQARRPLYQLRARKGTPARAEADRLAAVDAARMILNRDRAGAAGALKKAGYNEPERRAQMKRAEQVAKRANKTSWTDAIAEDALRNRIMRPASETIKQTILRSTDGGIRGAEIVTARSALASLIRRFDLEGKVRQQREAMREGLKIRKELAAEARHLPPEIRGKMLSAVATAKSAKDLAAGLKKADDALAEWQHKELVKEVEDLLSTDASKMRPEFRDAFNQIVGGLQKSEPSEKTASGLAKFAEWYEANKPEVDGEFVTEKDLIPQKRVDQLKRLSQTGVRGLTTDQLQDILDDAGRILHMNATKNMIIGRRALRDLDKTTAETTKQIEEFNKPLEEMDGGRKERGFFSSAMARRSSPQVMLAQIGGPQGILVRDLYRELALAQSDQYRTHLGMQSVMSEFFRSKGMTENDLIEWRAQPVKVEFGGKSLTLSRAQLVDLYAVTRNKDTLREVMDSGIIPEGFKGDKGKKVVPSREELNAAFSKMSDFDTEMADVMIGIFENEKPMLNDVSVKLEGFEKFEVPDYFPRSRDISGREEELTDLRQFTRGGAMENRGFTRERKSSGDPVVIEDAITVFDRHSKEVADYIAMAVPVRNALRIIGNPDVKQAITTRFGSEAVSDIKDYLRDASGSGAPVSKQDMDRLARSAQRLFATGKLGWRVTTILNNLFGAATQVAGVIDSKYLGAFVKNLGSLKEAGSSIVSSMPTVVRKKLETPEFRKDFNEMVSLDGYFEQRYERDPFNVIMYGRSSVDPSISSSKAAAALKRVQNLVMRPVQEAEKLSAIALYKAVRDNASKADAVAGMKYLFGDGNFNPDAADIVNQYAASYTMLTMRDTQNALDDLDKSSFARDMVRHPLKGIPYVFQSQLFKLNDMVRMAVIDLKAAGGWKKASPSQRKKFARALSSVAASAALIPTAVSEFWKEFREGFKEDDERQEAKRWGVIMSALFNLADVAAPEAGTLARVVGGAITGKNMGLGKGNYISETLDGLARGTRGLFSKKDGETEDELNERIEKAAKLLVKSSAMTGVPVESLYQLGEGVFNMMSPDDPMMPLLNERYLIRKKAGVDDVNPSAMSTAVKEGKITREELRRYYKLDGLIRAGNSIKKADRPDADEKIEKIVDKASP